MKENVFWFLSFYMLRTVYCIYFHEPSFVTITAKEVTERSKFGFSLGYQKNLGNLVVGAPFNDPIGQVFNCPMTDIFRAVNNYCSKINIDIKDYSRAGNPNQEFRLGASIAATLNYFLTCAPTRSAKRLSNVFSAYGTCYVYENGTAIKYLGPYEQYGINHHVKPGIIGSIGWRTLVDTSNNIILISKVAAPPLIGDVLHIVIEKPLQPVKSLLISKDKLRTENKEYLKAYRNVGTALATGNFFDSDTVYAISVRNDMLQSMILFLNYKPMLDTLFFMKSDSRKFIILPEEIPGTMFGAALCGVDLNKDGLSDLIIGAPAYSDDDSTSETGGIYIHLGGDMKTINDRNRMRKILGRNDGSRFGTTIAANDLDGDKVPEIFVSAPYEDYWIGALYILSGYEIYNRIINKADKKYFYVSDLKRTQKIQITQFQLYGYSLQVMPDLDNNGCDELAVGSPGNSKVILLRCIPTIDIYLTTRLINTKIVREQDNEFKVKVCAKVKYHSNKPKVYGNLKITNKIIGIGASIDAKQAIYPIDISDMKEEYCNEIVVTLSNNDPGIFKFLATADMDETNITNSKEFSESWVVISPNSKLVADGLDIPRHCTDDDCRPNLEITISWSGKNESYLLGSTESERITVQVYNSGNSSYAACVKIQLSGAWIDKINCINQDGGEYLCDMPKPLKRNTKFDINIHLNMSRMTNQDKYIKLKVRLHEICDDTTSKPYDKTIPLILNYNSVMLDGLSQTKNITDSEIIKQDAKIINNTHEYFIYNNGSVTWNNIKFNISVDKKPYIDSFRIFVAEGGRCTSYMDKFMGECWLNIMPYSTFKVIVTTVIAKNLIEKNLVNDSISVLTNASLILNAAAASVKFKGLTTIYIYQKEQTLGQNIGLIILISVILAVIVLAIIIYILYKKGFFKRQRLALKEEIKRMSMKQLSSGQMAPDINNDDVDKELEDDTSPDQSEPKTTSTRNSSGEK